MALELIGGAAVGALFGELVRAFMELQDNAMMFRSSMEQLEATLKSLASVIEEIEFYNHELNRPQSEIESLIRVMEGGKKLLCKCSRIRRWDYVRRVRYQAKLVELDKSLQRFVNFDMQIQMARDQKQMLLLIRSTILGPDHRGHQDLTVGMTVSQIGHTERGGMTLDLVGEAGFGVVREELLRARMEVMCKAGKSNPQLDLLIAILNSFADTMKIALYNRELNRPDSEIESLIRLIENGKKLLYKLSRIRTWDCVRKVRYQDKPVDNHALNHPQSNEFCCSSSTLNLAKDLSGKRSRPNVESDCKVFVK